MACCYSWHNRETEVIEKWGRFGLLAGIASVKAQGELAIYMEEAAVAMIANDTVMNAASGVFETIAFPMIRKAYVHDILTPENFGHVLNRMYQLVLAREERLQDVTGFPVHYDMEKDIVDTTMETIAREFLTAEAYQVYLYER